MARLRGSGWVFGGQFYALALALPTSILLARVLGPSGKGTITVVQLIANVSTVVLGIGLPGTITYLSARREVDGPMVTRIAWIWAACVAGLLGAIVLAAGGWLSETLFGDADPMFLTFGAITALPAMVLVLNGSFLIGTGRTREYAILNAAVQTGQVATFGVLWLLGRLTPMTAVFAWSACALAGAVAGSGLVWRHRSEALAAPVATLMKRGWKFGLASWFASGLGLLSLRADMFLVSAMVGTAAVGVYSISVTFAELALHLPNSVYAVMFPKISAEGAASSGVAARVNRSLWPLTMLFALSIAAAAILFVPLLFGDEFSGSIAPLWLLVPGITASAMGVVASAYLAGIGRPQAGAWASGVNIVINIGLNLLLIPVFGLAGAAVASSISYAAGAALLVFWFVKESGVSVGEALVPRREEIVSFVSAARAALRERFATTEA